MTASGEISAAESAQTRIVDALRALAVTQPGLARTLGTLAAVVVEEAAKNPRFANRLIESTAGAATGGEPKPKPGTVKRARRQPGPWDPYSAYAELGPVGLKDRLKQLDLEQLRDIVAEHGMDTDRLAMKWKTPERVIDRIVDRVVERAAKGEGFRNGHREPS